MTVAIVGTDLAPVHPGAGGIENLLWGWADELSRWRDVVVLSLPSGEPTQADGRATVKTFSDADDCRQKLTAIDPQLVVTNNRPLVGAGHNHVAILHNRFPAWRDPAYGVWRGQADECAPALNAAAAVVTVSRFLADDVSALIDRDVQVLRPFAAPAFFRAGRASVAKDAVVRYVGRLLEKKGIETVLSLARQMSDVRFEMTNFISPWTSPTAEHQRLQTLVAAAPNVVLVDPPSSVVQLAAVVASSSVVLIPSMWEEPFGLVSIEAQAARTHVLVNDVGGLPETVVDDRYVVDFADLGNIQERVRTYLDDPEPAAELVERVDQRFSRAASASGLNTIITEVLNQS